MRVKYATAGAAMRACLERANQSRPRLGALERSVLDAVFMVTVSYSKLFDTTTAREIARLAYGVDEVDGRNRERVRDALNRLATRDIGITITPTGRGRYARLLVSVDAAIPHEMGGYETLPRPPAAGSNTPHDWLPIPPASAAHLEVTEKFVREEHSPALEELGGCPNGCDEYGWIVASDKSKSAGSGRYCDLHPRGQMAVAL